MERQSFEIVWDALEDSPAEAANMSMRSSLLIAIEQQVRGWKVTQAEAARRLGITQPRLNDLLRGRITNFSLDTLINLAGQAGPRSGWTLPGRRSFLLQRREAPTEIAKALSPHGLILRGGFHFAPDETAPTGPSSAPAKSVLLVGQAGSGAVAAFPALAAIAAAGTLQPSRHMVARGHWRGRWRIRRACSLTIGPALSAVPAMGDARRGPEAVAARHPHASAIRAVARLSRRAAFRR